MELRQPDTVPWGCGRSCALGTYGGLPSTAFCMSTRFGLGDRGVCIAQSTGSLIFHLCYPSCHNRFVKTLMPKHTWTFKARFRSREFGWKRSEEHTSELQSLR